MHDTDRVALRVESPDASHVTNARAGRLRGQRDQHRYTQASTRQIFSTVRLPILSWRLLRPRAKYTSSAELLDIIDYYQSSVVLVAFAAHARRNACVMDGDDEDDRHNDI